MLCLLYLTVSTVLAIPHHHADDHAGAAKCHACHWQKNSVADEPAPAVVLIRTETELSFCSSFVALAPLRREYCQPSRGPPSFPL